MLAQAGSRHGIQSCFRLRRMSAFLPMRGHIVRHRKGHVRHRHLLLPHVIFIRVSHRRVTTIQDALGMCSFLHSHSAKTPAYVPSTRVTSFHCVLSCSRSRIVLAKRSVPGNAHMMITGNSLRNLQKRLIHCGGGCRVLMHVSVFNDTVIAVPTDCIQGRGWGMCVWEGCRCVW